MNRVKEWITASKLRTVIVVILIIIAAAFGGFFIWALTPRGPMEEALDALESDEEVEVEVADDRITFQSVEEEPTTGFVIYPGGRVDFRSYSPTAREIASEGFLVTIKRMPLNLAFFGRNAAQEVIDDHPEIDKWVVGGHSLGGVMAGGFAEETEVEGLVLWASYLDVDLSDRDIEALSLYGSKDGITTVEDVEEKSHKLPAEAEQIKIEGGNHAQFGWYGDQRGDEEPTISREKQQEIIVEETARFLGEL